MILTLEYLSRKEYYQSVVEYFSAWGIPADDTGRTDHGTMDCSSTNPGCKGMNTIPDNKVTARVTKRRNRFVIALRKDAREGKFSFEMFFSNGKSIWGTAHFIDEKRISIHIVTDWVLDVISV